MVRTAVTSNQRVTSPMTSENIGVRWSSPGCCHAASAASVEGIADSGRVTDVAVVAPKGKSYTIYVASASGGVWKTENAGITWTPIFDAQGSYSIGAVTLDPHNPEVVWVGTGENNAQRSVSFGDGVYKSEDGGRTWKNVGLKQSEHIGKIVLDWTQV